jgi:acetyltransferase-like isoleucine patch superfamily enzyme
MVDRPLRQLTLPEPALRVSEAWLDEIAQRLTAPDTDRSRLCRDALFAIWYPGLSDYDELVDDPATPLATRAALLALDPRHVTLEPEYYHEKDEAKYARVKPLLWLWQSFDRSPMGGGNVDLGVRLRRVLAPHIFRTCGRNFKCFQFVEFSFGYNMEVGDDVVVHRHVLLDDRETLVLADRASIADYANVYTHTHSITDQRDVTSKRTVLGPGTRITYHGTVLAGVEIGEEGMLGAMGLATRDIPPYHLAMGIPARPMVLKDTAPPAVRKASPLDP